MTVKIAPVFTKAVASPYQFSVGKNLAAHRWEFWIRQITPSSVYVGQPLSFTTAEDEMMTQHPTFALSPNEAQALMDEMYLAGIRPSAEGSVGEISALKYHLEDMRKIALEFLSLKK